MKSRVANFDNHTIARTYTKAGIASFKRKTLLFVITMMVCTLIKYCVVSFFISLTCNLTQTNFTGTFLGASIYASHILIYHSYMNLHSYTPGYRQALSVHVIISHSKYQTTKPCNLLLNSVPNNNNSKKMRKKKR